VEVEEETGDKGGCCARVHPYYGAYQVKEACKVGEERDRIVKELIPDGRREDLPVNPMMIVAEY